MFQDIVVSPSTIKVIGELIPTESGGRILHTLYNEKILIDSEKILLREYAEAIKALSPDKYQVLCSLFDLLLLGRTEVKKDVVVRERSKKEWDKLHSEVTIAQESKWRIIIADNIPRNTVSVIRDKHAIEVSSCWNYMYPHSASRIRVQETIEKYAGDEFDLLSWIGKYIQDAKHLILKDGYLMSTFAKKNLEGILRAIEPDIPISIETLMGDDKGESITKYVSSLGKEIGLKNVLPITLHENKRRINDRSLETDKFHINLGHALGVVDPITSEVIKAFTVSVLQR